MTSRGWGSDLHGERGLVLWRGRLGELTRPGLVANVLLGTEPLRTKQVGGPGLLWPCPGQGSSPLLSWALPASKMTAQAPAIMPVLPANRKEERSRKGVPLSIRTHLQRCT